MKLHLLKSKLKSGNSIKNIKTLNIK